MLTLQKLLSYSLPPLMQHNPRSIVPAFRMVGPVPYLTV